MRDYKIYVFSWNTQSVGICESMKKHVVEQNRDSLLSSWRDSKIPDFFEELKVDIIKKGADIIVLGFQEDRYPGSYFHSHLLPDKDEGFPSIGYTLLKRTKMMGVGVTTVTDLINFGDFHSRGVRISIYVKNEIYNEIKERDGPISQVVGNDGQSEYICTSSITRSKGAITSYLEIPEIGNFAIICCHLPFNPTTLKEQKLRNDPMIRQNEINKINICFNDIYGESVIKSKYKPDYVIMFGDLNYRVSNLLDVESTANKLIQSELNKDYTFINSIYTEFDELKAQIDRNNVYAFEEGVNNSGPNFLPTCKMVKNRNSLTKPNATSIWKLGKLNQRMPSWCDRILYKKHSERTKKKLKCTYYNKFDLGMINQSDHDAVIAVIETCD